MWEITIYAFNFTDRWMFDVMFKYTSKVSSQKSLEFEIVKFALNHHNLIVGEPSTLQTVLDSQHQQTYNSPTYY